MPIPPPPSFSMMRKWEIVFPNSEAESDICAHLRVRLKASQRIQTLSKAAPGAVVLGEWAPLRRRGGWHKLSIWPYPPQQRRRAVSFSDCKMEHKLLSPDLFTCLKSRT